MSLSHWLRGKSELGANETTDIVIVGGGYLGLSIAWWLTEYRPQTKITILERDQFGLGASGRNAGFLTAGSSAFYQGLSRKWGEERAVEILHFAKDSLELVHQNILKNSKIEFTETKSVTLLREKTDFNFSHFGFEAKEQNTINAGLKKSYIGTLERKGEFKVNPMSLIKTLKEELKKRNVRLMEFTSAFELTPDGVKTETNFIKAKQVVLALNGYFPQFHEVFKQHILPKRAQMLAVELDTTQNWEGLFYDPSERVYFRQVDSKILIIGGKRLLDEAAENSDFDKVSVKIQQGLENYLTHELNLKFKILNRWSGIMGFTEHELPYVTKITAQIPTVVVGGFSGHGMGFGFKAAQEAAQLTLGEMNQSFFDTFKGMNISL